jgi:3-oxoacyl-[acyl-carrier protein] reductase
MEVSDFDLVVRVHARGTFLGIREAARRMKDFSIAGSIINVTSSAGLDGTVGQINYSAAKGAVISMTKSAARELGKWNIRVNSVSPAAATPMTEKLRTVEKLSQRYLARVPLGRWAEPSEVAHVFAFLASDDSSYVTGQVLCADGGVYMAS